jgi:hypothetical protein
MEGIPGDYEVDPRGPVHHGEALLSLDADTSDLAFFAGVAPPPQLIAGLHRRVRTGGVLVGANLPNSRNPWMPEYRQHWPPVSGAGSA